MNHKSDRPHPGTFWPTVLKVNSAIDDALAFFKARNLNARAEDLAAIKDGISNGISVIRAAIQGLEAIESTLKQMKAIAQSAISRSGKHNPRQAGQYIQ